jgi:adhesin/invasin
MDKNGNPVEGASLKVVPFAGSVPDSAPASDAKGLVTLHWTLGTKAGSQQLELAAGSGPVVRVIAKALPMEPANVNPPVMPATWPAGRPLGRPVTVTVTDAYGNAIPNVQVVFSATTGSAAPLRVMTDAKGQAATKWMLGAAASDQVLTAAVKGTPAKTTITVKAVKPTATAKAPTRK